MKTSIGSCFLATLLLFPAAAGPTSATLIVNGTFEPGSPPDNGMRVLFNGALVFENLNAISGFGTFSFTHLQATGSTTTVEFQGRNVLGFDYLDDVSVTASPIV